ncbi:hypothetical protein GOARA_064_01800 [Gordonia araii NBRC 100433]|uniref:Uncharacterized protein n=1 Tax=Gordonia araii NBRC 100433 TaxID=1073574 RepID=G7H5Q3_9ACTN|nr:hypothetical protein [Gordonia araii]NNG95890.1 hypothetical protein [Gordonia araii NBRC 100433]GAB11178.1 hypothetical protein GOARA_064_01800 [Gordonia araii NBRC 100433]
MSGAPLRLAVEIDDRSDRRWVELTPSAPDDVERFAAPTLRDAAQRTARSPLPAFVDLDVYLAETVSTAFAGYARLHPEWTPGSPTESLVHAGTASTLAGLLWDIWAARVADGVTLRSADPHLVRRVVSEVLPLLTVRGLAVETRSTASVA